MVTDTISTKLPKWMADELNGLVEVSMIPKSALVREAIRRLLANKDKITLGKFGVSDEF